MLPRSHSTLRCVVLLGLVCLLAGGCGPKTPAPPSKVVSGAASTGTAAGKAPPMSASSADEYDYDDPCSLLEPSEVEAVLGARLATPPFRSGGDPDDPKVDGDDCIYETSNFRYISVEVDFKDGPTAYGMINFGKKVMNSAPGQLKQALKLNDGTELTGEWDEATLLPMNCCNFAALRGDQLVEIDFTATDATLPQAAKLVDAAFGRIDQPLKIDGGANVDSALALSKTRPQPVAPCSLLSRAEVEALIGKLIADPVANGTDECDYQLPANGRIPQIYGLQTFWRGGYEKWRSDAHIADVASGALKQTVYEKGRGDTVYRKDIQLDLHQAVADTGGWEYAGINGPSFVAVKKDVLLKMGLVGVDRDKVKKLVSAAIHKIL
ncbi:MAG: hypothetical protein ACRENQ_04845 [Gemmatimonadaceae bacterium]